VDIFVFIFVELWQKCYEFKNKTNFCQLNCPEVAL